MITPYNRELNLERARERVSVTFHVVHGEEGFDRTFTARRTKIGRVLHHEFHRVERAGYGFVRIEFHQSREGEMHFEYSSKKGWMSRRPSVWITNHRGQSS